MTFLADPRIFNAAIIAMFLAASVRWAFEKNWPQTFYWLSAAALNVAVCLMK